MQFKIKNKGKEILQGELVIDINKVTLKKGLAFRVAYDALQKYLHEGDDNITDHYECIARCVSEYTGVSMDALYNAENGFNIVNTLFESIVRVMSQHKIKDSSVDYVYEYKGDIYTIKNYWTKHESHQDLTMAESIEILEAKRRVESKKNSDKLDDQKNAMFTEILHILAITSRKEGEVFPISQTEIDAYIDARVVYLQDIGYVQATDAAFFLTDILQILQKTQDVNTSLTHPSPRLEAKQS